MGMGRFGVCFLLFASFLRAHDAPKPPASEEEAKAALAAFEELLRAAKSVEERQHAVYDLRDVRHDLVLARIEKLLRAKESGVRNVAALALGGQVQSAERAGTLLMKTFEAQYKDDQVLASVLMSVKDLKYLKYWPAVEVCLKDERNSIVIGSLNLLGHNQDYRALPRLLEMYRISLPKRVSWSTGEVNVDTGAAGDADQKAAEAAFSAKYGEGGSKEKAKAKAKARSQDDRNFSTELRRTVKAITGQDFPTAVDFEDWYLENYTTVARKIAEMEGRDPEAAAKKAAAELPALKLKAEEERKKLEEEAARQARDRAGK